MNKEEEIRELAKVICRAIILNKGQDYFVDCKECLFENGGDRGNGCLWLARELIGVGFRKEEYAQKHTAKVILGAYYKCAKKNKDNKITLSLKEIKSMGNELYGIEVDE